MTEPVKGHNHDTEADLELDSLRTQLRETERERDEAREAVEFWKDENARTIGYGAGVLEERDIARKECNGLLFSLADAEQRAALARADCDAATQRAEEAERQLEKHKDYLEKEVLARNKAWSKAADDRKRAEEAESTTRGAALELSRVSRELGLTLARAEEAEAQADMLSKQCEEQEHELVARFARAESAEAALRVAREALEKTEERITQAWLQARREEPYDFGLGDLLRALDEPDARARAALAPKEGAP